MNEDRDAERIRGREIEREPRLRKKDMKEREREYIQYQVLRPLVTDLAFFMPLKHMIEPRAILSLILKINNAVQYKNEECDI